MAFFQDSSLRAFTRLGRELDDWRKVLLEQGNLTLSDVQNPEAVANVIVQLRQALSEGTVASSSEINEEIAQQLKEQAITFARSYVPQMTNMMLLLVMFDHDTLFTEVETIPGRTEKQPLVWDTYWKLNVHSGPELVDNFRHRFADFGRLIAIKANNLRIEAETIENPMLVTFYSDLGQQLESVWKEIARYFQFDFPEDVELSGLTETDVQFEDPEVLSSAKSLWIPWLSMARCFQTIRKSVALLRKTTLPSAILDQLRAIGLKWYLETDPDNPAIQNYNHFMAAQKTYDVPLNFKNGIDAYSWLQTVIDESVDAYQKFQANPATPPPPELLIYLPFLPVNTPWIENIIKIRFITSTMTSPAIGKSVPPLYIGNFYFPFEGVSMNQFILQQTQQVQGVTSKIRTQLKDAGCENSIEITDNPSVLLGVPTELPLADLINKREFPELRRFLQTTEEVFRIASDIRVFISLQEKFLGGDECLMNNFDEEAMRVFPASLLNDYEAWKASLSSEVKIAREIPDDLVTIYTTAESELAFTDREEWPVPDLSLDFVVGEENVIRQEIVGLWFMMPTNGLLADASMNTFRVQYELLGTVSNGQIKNAYSVSNEFVWQYQATSRSRLLPLFFFQNEQGALGQINYNRSLMNKFVPIDGTNQVGPLIPKMYFYENNALMDLFRAGPKSWRGIYATTDTATAQISQFFANLQTLKPTKVEVASAITITMNPKDVVSVIPIGNTSLNAKFPAAIEQLQPEQRIQAEIQFLFADANQLLKLFTSNDIPEARENATSSSIAATLHLPVRNLQDNSSFEDFYKLLRSNDLQRNSNDLTDEFMKEFDSTQLVGTGGKNLARFLADGTTKNLGNKFIALTRDQFNFMKRVYQALNVPNWQNFLPQLTQDELDTIGPEIQEQRRKAHTAISTRRKNFRQQLKNLQPQAVDIEPTSQDIEKVVKKKKQTAVRRNPPRQARARKP